MDTETHDTECDACGRMQTVEVGPDMLDELPDALPIKCECDACGGDLYLREEDVSDDGPPIEIGGDGVDPSVACPKCEGDVEDVSTFWDEYPKKLCLECGHEYLVNA